jgi:putative transposase
MARVVVAGVPHHVTQRGNRRETVFFDGADFRRYLALLEQYSRDRGLDILAYCLMNNHLHLVAVPREEASLASVLKPVHLRYAQHVNWKHRLGGRLWQGRYYSCPLDHAHTAAAIAYTELNPVRAHLVPKAEDYAWSSAAAHAGLHTDSLLSPSIKNWVDADDWPSWLREFDDEDVTKRLRLHTRTGRPLGEDGFVERLESSQGRRLHALSRGRPARSPVEAR